MYNNINSSVIPILTELAIEFEGQSIDQCAKNIAAKYNVSDSDALFLANEIAVGKIFKFTKGEYTIEIFSTSFLAAQKAWHNLIKRNYYPTGRKWYTATQSCDAPTTEVPFKKGDTKKFLDYTIKYCTNNDGIVLLKEGISALDSNAYESHLGNYSTLDTAQAAAVVFFMLARPNVFATSLLHKIMDGAGSGTYHEYAKLLEVCTKEKIQLPSEITRIGGMNSLIGYKGRALCWTRM